MESDLGLLLIIIVSLIRGGLEYDGIGIIIGSGEKLGGGGNTSA